MITDKQYTQKFIEELNEKLKSKQAALSFDDIPTVGSVNPVTSEGIKNYVDNNGGTKYKAGNNIQINGTTISATDTRYVSGANTYVTSDNIINAFSTFNKAKTVRTFLKDVTPTTWESISVNVSIVGSSVWTDGYNIYYSGGDSSQQFVLDESTFTWQTMTWQGLPNNYYLVGAEDIWTDGVNIYAWDRFGTNNIYHYKLTVNGWAPVTWNEPFNTYGVYPGSHIWSDGYNIYYSNNSYQYVLDKSTSTWSVKAWYGLAGPTTGKNIWTDGDNIYYSSGSTSSQKILNKSESAWYRKTWDGPLTSFYGADIWTDGENIYYNDYSQNNYYILNRETSMWVRKTWNGIPIVYGQSMLAGRNICHIGDDIYSFNTEYSRKLKKDICNTTKTVFKKDTYIYEEEPAVD